MAVPGPEPRLPGRRQRRHRTSTAPYVALLNNDALAEPGWLAALVAALDADPDMAFAASRMLFTNARG